MARTKATRASVTPTYQLLPVEDLSGGLDLRSTPTAMAADKARVLRNYSLEEPGAIRVRPGYSQFSSGSLGSARIQGGQRVYLSSYTFTLIGYAGAIYKPTDSGAYGAAVYSTVSGSNQVYFPYDRDLVAVFDGDNRPRKSSNGTLWRRMGLDASTGTAPALSSRSSGGLSASEFEFGFTYKERGQSHESNLSAKSTITLGSTGAVEFAIPNSSDVQADAWVAYGRNKTSGETVLRKISSGALGSSAGSTGTNSTFRVDSSAWTANDEAPTDHDVPPALAFGVVWKNRWWGKSGTRGNRLHFTQLFQPQSWPAAFYIDIPFERGDSIAAVVPQGDTLLVFGQSKVFLIIGQTSLDFEVRPAAGAQAGALGPRAVEALEQGVVHASAEGAYIFDGATDRALQYDIDPGWMDLIKNGSPTDLQLIDLCYHVPRKELRIAVPRLYPRGVAGEWVLDLDRTRRTGAPAWTDTDRHVGGYITWDGNEATPGDRGRLFTWSDTNGTLFEEAVGTTANSSNMTAEYQGPALATGLHRARVIDVHGEYEPNAGSFTVETLVDDVSQGGAMSISIGQGLATYDSTSVYDTAIYAGVGRKHFVKELPLSAEGRTIVQKTAYSGTQRFRQFTYAYGIVPEPETLGFND